MQIYKKFLEVIEKNNNITIQGIEEHDQNTATIYLEYGECFIAYHFKDRISAEIALSVNRLLDSKEETIADKVINKLNEDSYLYFYHRHSNLITCQSFTLLNDREDLAVELFYYLTSPEMQGKILNDFSTLLDIEIHKE